MKIKYTIIFFAMIAFLAASNAMADSRLQALFSLSTVTDSLQDIDYTDKGKSLADETGSGILFDWTMKTPDSIFSGGLSNHAVSIDYYTLKEADATNAINVENIFVGYRYHFLSRFYVGASAALVSEIETGIGPDSQTASATPLAYTFGYTSRFPIGFTLGVHVFRTLSEDYEYDEGGKLEDVALSLIGLTLGFRF